MIRASFWILFIGLFSPFKATSQELIKYELFQLEGNELFWQNTYEYSEAPENLRTQVVQMLKSKFFTFNLTRDEAGYSGEIRHYEVDYKRYGRNYLTTPRMYLEGDWSGKFIVEILDKQYRVTVYALYYEKMEKSNVLYRSEKLMKGRYITAVTTKGKKEFKKGELKNLALMSLSLKDNFDIRNASILPEKK